MATKVMISLPEGLLAELDRVAGEEHRSRSELLREAFRVYVEVRGRRRPPREMAEVRSAVALQDELARLSPGRGEDSAEDVRRWREARS
jgi:metal-responsive CopG/Arc/MetJ family transcriptional regulator